MLIAEDTANPKQHKLAQRRVDVKEVPATIVAVHEGAEVVLRKNIVQIVAMEILSRAIRDGKESSHSGATSGQSTRSSLSRNAPVLLHLRKRRDSKNK